MGCSSRPGLPRALWIASVTSNIGMWVQGVGAAWTMTSLAPSPLMVALVDVVAGLPIFLLSIPAGALADLAPGATKETPTILERYIFDALAEWNANQTQTHGVLRKGARRVVFQVIDS